jgi:hypothetical protein
MKRFTTLVISCSLALVTGAMAQQDGAQQPTPNKKEKQHERAQARKERQENRAVPMNANENRHKARAPMNAEHEKAPGAANRQADQRPARHRAQTAATERDENNAAPSSTEKSKARANAHAETNAANTPVNRRTANQQKANQQTTEQQRASQQTANQPKANKGKKTKKPDAQVVRQIKEKHANFHAQARPQQVPSVTFRQDYRISNSQNWQGERYAAFRNYRPERHDAHWYRSRYDRIVLIGGGYYYWNAGYWYPAWGYDPAQAYYAYNGPIYTGTVAEPPDRVIADVQATLQDMGYYKGEVDGLLGPLTREALTEYQSDNGLYTTAAIDQPTLDSLGMGA